MEILFLITKLVENTKANEYCRAAAIEALVIMTEIGEYKEDLYQYFNELFKTLEREPIFPWSILSQSTIVLFKNLFLKEVNRHFTIN